MTRYARGLQAAFICLAIAAVCLGLAGLAADSPVLGSLASACAVAVMAVVLLDIARGLTEARAARRRQR